jgi:hypothetical protein
MLIKPVFSDHLSYVTLFQCSLGRSHRIGLTVITIFRICKLQLCWNTRWRKKKTWNLSFLHYLCYICRKIFTFIRKLYSDTDVAFNFICAILSSPVTESSVNGIFGSSTNKYGQFHLIIKDKKKNMKFTSFNICWMKLCRFLPYYYIIFWFHWGELADRQVSEWIVSHIMARTSFFSWNDEDICFKLYLHAKLDFYIIH